MWGQDMFWVGLLCPRRTQVVGSVTHRPWQVTAGSCRHRHVTPGTAPAVRPERWRPHALSVETIVL